MNNNHVYLAFERQVDRTSEWLRARVKAVSGYSSGVVFDRLLQRIVELTLRAYGTAVSQSRTQTDPLPAPGTRIECGAGSIAIGRGEFHMTARQFLASQRDFLMHWVYGLTSIASPMRSPGRSVPTVLGFGIGDVTLFRDGSDAHFVTYCRSGAVQPLREGKRLLIESKSGARSSTPEEFVYTRHPLIHLLREAKLGLRGRAGMIAHHLRLFVAYEAAVLRLPVLALLGKDFAYASIARDLDTLGLIDGVVLTCSNYDNQAIWMRGLTHGSTHMVWYSQNSKPPSYTVDQVTSDVPNYRWIRVDRHWVWTTQFATYLRGLGMGGKFDVVGPLIWSLPERTARADAKIEIAVFDISPFSDAVALRFGEITNYNNPRNVEAFIRDVLSLRPELERRYGKDVSIRLKTKRGFQEAYDQEYFRMIESLASAGSISLDHHTTNMFGMISSSHLVIAYPFTSPVYVADALGVPSIYYDPTASIAPAIFGDAPSLIRFACGRDELLGHAISALESSDPIGHDDDMNRPLAIGSVEPREVKACDR